MGPNSSVANQLLNIEQKLNAYQKLHQEELAELRNSLDECKRLIVASCNEEDFIVPKFEKREENNIGA